MADKKYTFTKENPFTGEQMVKRTKSAALAKLLDEAGWKHETSGGAKAAKGDK